jgi:hypothetical protein
MAVLVRVRGFQMTAAGRLASCRTRPLPWPRAGRGHAPGDYKPAIVQQQSWHGSDAVLLQTQWGSALAAARRAPFTRITRRTGWHAAPAGMVSRRSSWHKAPTRTPGAPSRAVARLAFNCHSCQQAEPLARLDVGTPLSSRVSLP